MTARNTMIWVALMGLVACSATENDGGSDANKEPADNEVHVVDFVKAPDSIPARTSPHTVEEVAVTGSEVRRSKMNVGMADMSLAVPASSSRSGVPYAHVGPRASLERYPEAQENGFMVAREHPVSTFSVDVDTASYANVRRWISSGQLPPADAVRIEELINYFDYQYPEPKASDQPFSISTGLAPSPWHGGRHILQVGLRGHDVPLASLPPANLVFLIDTSGSMQAANKMPLVKSALGLLLNQLDGEDRVSLVVYAGSAGVVLEPTPGDQHQRIRRALERLRAGGSTNGGAGITLAYDLARQGYVEGGINRVILATDGDFNVGLTDHSALEEMVGRQRERGVTLSVMGFGSGNYNDAVMQRIAQIGDGNASYIDTMNEARKVLVDEMAGTLATIAKDVKIQIEFNPAIVAEYRLVGYETRQLRQEDFNNDRVDAGDIGAGHTVTALYELTLQESTDRAIDSLRYGAEVRYVPEREDEIAHVKLRYKAPQGDNSRLITTMVQRSDIREGSAVTEDLRFAMAVAGFGQILKGGRYRGDTTYSDVLSLAIGSKGADPGGHRSEFINLVRTAAALTPRETDALASSDSPPRHR